MVLLRIWKFGNYSQPDDIWLEDLKMLYEKFCFVQATDYPGFFISAKFEMVAEYISWLSIRSEAIDTR